MCAIRRTERSGGTELGNRMYPVEFEEKGGKVIGEGAPTWVDENLPNTAAALWYSTETGLLYAAK